ncbi:uncharacterized protein PHA67_007629 [Liasis olivaceus]
MGNAHRQKVSSKVIFLLHCTGLAQLSFYAIVGAYSFTLCNHTAIKTDYQNMLQNIIEKELNKANNTNQHTKNCCSLKSQDILLGCIRRFTRSYFCPSEIWNFTDTLLKERCDGYSEVNGCQNQPRKIRKCNMQPRRPNEIYVLLELREMWYSYEAYEDTTLSLK